MTSDHEQSFVPGDEDRDNGGTQRMNCYLCLVETGCASRAAVAVCQRCGAGMCGAHLRELSATSVAGLAGTPRTILLCCRCAPSPVAPAARPMSKQQGKYGKSGWRWWGRHRLHGELPNPAEAVAYSCEEDARAGFPSPASLLGASPCRPCGSCSYGLRALRKAMRDCDGFVTVKLPIVTCA